MKINFKKKYGQNFLKDDNLLAGIVEDAGITSNDVVLEIGAGAGALTKHLSKKAKRVVSFEIDKELASLLLDLNLPNVEFVFDDVLNCSMQKIEQLCGKKYKLVANLPYYITTPILTKFLTMDNKPQSITVMVQKEVGDRITAKNGSSDYGYFSVYCQLQAKIEETRFVPKEMFTPMPKVDSCIIRFTDICHDNVPDDLNEFCKSLFVMKRKTLVNNLLSSKVINVASKEDLIKALAECGIKENARSEELSIDDIKALHEKLKKHWHLFDTYSILLLVKNI